ncbi:DUF997 family protein [Siminovitchia sp. 179-K 8D1 HS]|uniref:DUF997 family protein n=1 Tax=Siminovitchia sp. 179-K 8D1 HS TaxID=3142385 RepID=UPI00399F0AB8
MKKTEDHLVEDSRFAQCTFEMRVVLGLFAVNIILMGGVPLAIGLNKSASSMSFILGFPDWYFWGGIVGSILFSILPYFMVKYFFKDMSIEAEDEG